MIRRGSRLVLAGLLGLAGAVTWYSVGVGDATSVGFVTIARGTQSGIVRPSRSVITTPDEWAALWAQHTAHAEPPPPRPPVDFVCEMVVAVFAGERPTGGHAVEITRIVPEGSAATVYYRETTPPPGSFVTEALTHPFHIVRLRRLDLPIVFQRE